MKSVLKFVATLLTDQKNGSLGLSLGRVTFIALFLQAMWIWSGFSAATDLPSGMMGTLTALMAYNFSSKGVEAFKSYLEKRK